MSVDFGAVPVHPLRPPIQHPHRADPTAPRSFTDRTPDRLQGSPNAHPLKSKCSILTFDLSTSFARRTPLKSVPLLLPQLPPEVLANIFSHIQSRSDLRACLLTCKLFYNVAKPIYFEQVVLTSTYRVAQFVTYLRLNPRIGHHVRTIDLSGLRLGLDEAQALAESLPNLRRPAIATDLDLELHQLQQSAITNIDDDAPICAGWRDWKLKGTPLYSFQQLSKIVHVSEAPQKKLIRSHESARSSSTMRTIAKRSWRAMTSSLHFLRRKRRRDPRIDKVGTSTSSADLVLLGETDFVASTITHPMSHKLLHLYGMSRDIPIGYIIHMIELCPNLGTLNLANVCISTDYVLDKSKAARFRAHDLIHHYPKHFIHTINGMTINPMESNPTYSLVDKLVSFSRGASRVASASPSAASSFTFHPSKMKYHSLLPPVGGNTDTDPVGDGNRGRRLFLSDLSLKAVHHSYLRKVNERELLTAVANMHHKHHYAGSEPPYISNSLKCINLLSMVWIDQASARHFLAALTTRRPVITTDDDSSDAYSFTSVSKGPGVPYQNLVVDFSNAGMRTNLGWAQRFDMRTPRGRKRTRRFLNGESMDEHERSSARRLRRQGRWGENFFF